MIPNLDELLAASSKLAEMGDPARFVAGFVVAPDVAEKLKSLPAVKSLVGPSFTIHVVRWLEPGSWYPIDRNGNPIPKGCGR